MYYLTKKNRLQPKKTGKNGDIFDFNPPQTLGLFQMRQV